MTEEEEFAARFEQESASEPKSWELEVTKRTRGSIRTVIASSRGKPEWQFDFHAGPDGNSKRISAKRI